MVTTQNAGLCLHSEVGSLLHGVMALNFDLGSPEAGLPGFLLYSFILENHVTFLACFLLLDHQHLRIRLVLPTEHQRDLEEETAAAGWRLDSIN